MANANPQQSETVQFQKRPNSRRIMERFITGQHVSLQRLREQMLLAVPEGPMVRYIIKEIPPYPTPVEFWVSDVAHVTEEVGFQGILESEQFRPPESEFSWWDLKINEENIRAAEKRYMERNFPNEAQEVNEQKPFLGNFPNQAQELDEQKPFLEKFTTSPLFQLKKSRFGNYRFTFPLTELMERYKDQNCGGEEPVLRVYETITYKQEIVYTVLIHSPEFNKQFSKYPLLEESEWVRYQDGEIIWKAQAICETHQYELDSGEVQELHKNKYEYYVWDQVSLVFHLPKGTKLFKALKFSRERLIEALEACELVDEKIDLSRYKGSKIKTERFKEATENVDALKKQLEEKEKESKYDDLKMEVDP